MKKLLLLPILMILSQGFLSAQDTSIVHDYNGGFLDFYIGSVTNNSHNLRVDLNNGGPFGEQRLNFQNINTGPDLGVRTMVIFDRGVLLGARLGYSFLSSVANDSGGVKLSGASAEFLLGKSIYNKKGLFIYPYLGIGFYKYFLNVKNNMVRKPLLFDPVNPLMPGESATYTANHPIFELGIGFKKSFSRKITAGFDLGFYFSSTTASTFKRGPEAVEFRSAPGLNGAFLRISIDLVHYGKKMYIDTVRPVYQAPVGGPAAEEKPAEKEEKKEEKRKKKKEVKAEEKKEPEKPVEEKKTVEKKEEPAKKTVKESKPKKAAPSKPGKVNYNEQLFNFGKEPAKSPAAKDTSNQVVPQPPSQVPDSTNVKEPK
jgi:hypothetical protein